VSDRDRSAPSLESVTAALRQGRVRAGS
jgi:hypothetical protein